MIQPGMIGHEIQHQSHSPFVHPLPESLQGQISAKVGTHRIICNRKTGTADVFLLKIWQKLSELVLPL